MKDVFRTCIYQSHTDRALHAIEWCGSQPLDIARDILCGGGGTRGVPTARQVASIEKSAVLVAEYMEGGWIFHQIPASAELKELVKSILPYLSPQGLFDLLRGVESDRDLDKIVRDFMAHGAPIRENTPAQ